MKEKTIYDMFDIYPPPPPQNTHTIFFRCNTILLKATLGIVDDEHCFHVKASLASRRANQQISRREMSETRA